MNFFVRISALALMMLALANCSATSNKTADTASISAATEGERLKRLKNAFGRTGARSALASRSYTYRSRRGKKAREITIRGDRGGELIRYARAVRKAARNGNLVRIGGHCDSACTLYLALPRKQLCLLPGATFRFHHPYGSSKRNNRIAAQYMMRAYPGWVRSWLGKRGGLNSRLKAINYDTASRHITPCEKREKSRRTA